MCKQMGETQNPGFKVLLHHIEQSDQVPATGDRYVVTYFGPQCSVGQCGAQQQKRRTLRARWSSKARSAAIAMSDETAARVMS